MKTFKTVLALAFLGVFFTACDKDTTGDVARETQYPLFEKTGADVIFLEEGSTFTEPGIKATEGGATIDVETTASGYYRGTPSLDASKADLYNITYKATNKDGYAGTDTRQVWVAKTGDLVNSIEGLYTATIVRNGQLRFSDVEYVLIYKNSDGTYTITCALGSYYEYGVGYTPSFGLPFHAPVKITANDIGSNDFSFETSRVQYSGWPEAVNMQSMTVDAGNKKINFETVWDAGFTFEVELTQVEI